MGIADGEFAVPSWEQAVLDAAEKQRVIHDTKRTELTMYRMNGELVVSKRFRMCDEEALDRYHAEVKMLYKMAAGSSKFVMPLGHVTKPPTFAVVLPVFVHGSLDKVIHSGEWSYALPLKLLWMLDMVDAVAHCHSQGVIVRDIKPGNMLVDEHWNAKMSDFELAKGEDELDEPVAITYGGPSSRRKTRFEGTPEYMAPELLKAPGSQLQRGIVKSSRATDVYSIGISLNQIATGTVPYTDVNTTTEQLHTVVETRYTPSALHHAIINENLRPHLCDEAGLRALVEKCWSGPRDERPRIEDVLVALTNLFDSPAAMEADRKVLITAQEAAPAAPSPVPSSHSPLSASPVNAAEPRTWPEVLRDLAGEPPNGRAGTLPKLIDGQGEGTAGRRELMEDEWFQETFHRQGERSGARVYGVLDGHGGYACAKFVKDHLPAELEKALLHTEKNDVKQSIHHAFDAVQALWQDDEARDNSGACATIALILAEHVWIAWCGDCSAMVVRDGVAVPLTQDHHANTPSERQRIEATGATVTQTADGKWRINGKIAVCRAFGDVVHPAVTHKPDIMHFPLRSVDQMLVLATDGIWDVMTPDMVCTALNDTVKHKDYGAKRLCCDAYNLGTEDNMGAMVVYFIENQN
eukprot:TRINITY_DN22628_c0_g1_i1.p1 TRINITY_DN22628_c0_g1~~TRINITY_DN22628_c0_g1_i1.p1  ORF type:complete len:636 (+),score=266.86 TRINITY_DN22628_c0_g1_i1:78-1985(+)